MSYLPTVRTWTCRRAAYATSEIGPSTLDGVPPPSPPQPPPNDGRVLLAENATQAVARDVMLDAVVRLSAAGYRIVLTVHDEIVAEVPNGFGSFGEFVRLALTEDEPTIKPYNEAEWAKLDDVTGTPIEVSLSLMDSLHQRWVVLLKSLKPEDLKRKFKHPENGLMTLERTLAMYAWHGRHHVAHITSLRDRNGWK